MISSKRVSDQGFARQTAQKLLRESARIFVAYAHSDYRAARDVRRRIVRLRRDQDPSTVFMDQEQLAAGSSVKAGETLKALRNADLVVVLCGRETPSSGNVREEIQQALRQRKSGQTSVLPVILGRQPELPEGIGDAVQGIFLTNLFPAIRWWRWGIVAALTVALLIVAWTSHKAAVARKDAQDKLAQRFVAVIGRSGVWQLSADEEAALWDLAKLDPANQNIRTKLFDFWLQSADFVPRAAANYSCGLHAAIGLNRSLAEDFNSHASVPIDRLAEALANPQETDPKRLRKLSLALKNLAPWISPTNARSVAERLAKALEDSRETYSLRLSSLAQALAALAARMNPTDAAAVAARGAVVLAKAIETYEGPNGDQKEAALAVKEAIAVVDKLKEADEVSSPESSYHLFRLADALAALAQRMNPAEASPVVGRGVLALAKALENPQGYDSVQVVSSSAQELAALAPWINPTDADSAADGLAKALVDSGRHTDPRYMSNWAEALAALAPRMSPANASLVAEQLGNALGNMEEARADLSTWTHALKALAERMNADDAAHLAGRVAEALEDLRGVDTVLSAPLVGGLTALAGRMNPTDAALVADGLAKTLEDPHNPDVRLRWPLADALPGVAARMSPNDAAIVAEGLAEALENPQEADLSNLSILAQALAGMAARMSPSDAASVTTRGAAVLAKALENPQEADLSRLSVLAEALAGMAARMSPSDAASVTTRGAAVLAKAMENPPKDPVTGDFYLSQSLDAVAALAPRMSTTEAAPLAERLAKRLENSQTMSFTLRPSLVKALAALAARMNPSEVASVADGLVKTLENPQEADLSRLSVLAEALAGMAARMSPNDITLLAERLVRTLELPQETDSFRLSSLADALAALAPQMSHAEAASLAESLSKTLENPQTSSERLLNLAVALEALAPRMNAAETAPLAARVAAVLANTPERDSIGALEALAAQIPPAKQTRLVALSRYFLMSASSPPENGLPEEEWRRIARICESLDVKELASVLKWPFCVGEAQKLVLAKLEKKTQRNFGGDVWKFVEQTDSLDIQGLNRRFLDLPAERPRIEDAIKELQALAPPTSRTRPSAPAGSQKSFMRTTANGAPEHR